MDMDVTNNYELGGYVCCLVGEYAVMWVVLMNILNTFRWKNSNKNVDCSKMITINTLLLLFQIFKLFSFYYGIFGFVLSNLTDISLYQNFPNIYFNSKILLASQFLAISIQNFILILCSKYWHQILVEKDELEAQKNIFYRKNRLIIFMKKAMPFFLLLIVLISIFGTIVSMIDYQNQSIVVRILITGSTFLSAILFSTYCIILRNNLEKFYNVDRQYKKRLSIYSVVLISTQFVRVAFNLLLSIDDFGTFLFKFKTGQDKGPYPQGQLLDQYYNWAIFNFVYNLITDFIPTILIGKLFTPKEEKYSSSLLKVDDWDIVSTV
ncbi:hypothetical protein pb186bvf_002276 [Paramecium bursaria]